jgi:hypothetical protein
MRRFARPALVAAVLIGGATSLAGSDEAIFLAENDAAMARMMAAMHVQPTGDVDADFVAAMVPHHSVSLFDQGLLQVLQASVTGIEPKQPYVLALARAPDGGGALEPLAVFTTNPAGSAIVNALGPIRQVVRAEVDADRRYLVIAPGTPTRAGAPVQIQAKDGAATR